MKNLLILTFVCLSLTGCTTFSYQYLQGDYLQGIVWKESPKSYDETFTKAIEVMTQQGILASTIDRPNGFIQFYGEFGLSEITFERKGEPQNPKRSIVTPEGVPLSRLGVNIVVLVQQYRTGSRVGVRLIVANKDLIVPSISGETASLGNYERYILDQIVP